MNLRAYFERVVRSPPPAPPAAATQESATAPNGRIRSNGHLDTFWNMISDHLLATTIANIRRHE